MFVHEHTADDQGGRTDNHLQRIVQTGQAVGGITQRDGNVFKFVAGKQQIAETVLAMMKMVFT